MAFNVSRILGGRQNIPETLVLPVTAGESYAVGEALVAKSGKLTKATGDVAVNYISLESYSAPTEGARGLACFKVTPDMLFEVPVSAVDTAKQMLGAKVTIGTDGLTVTASAATVGGAEVVSAEGIAKAGDTVTVALK